MTILGELLPKNGSIWTKKSISFKPQESWLFNGTIRHNITFGEEFLSQKYEKVLKACCFEKVRTLFFKDIYF